MKRRDELLDSLLSSSSFERLQAARDLRGLVTPVDRELLVAAERRESDAYVSSALSELIDEVGSASTQVASASDFGESIDDEAQQKGELDALRQFLHEISPLYGLVEASARSEFDGFDSSKTCQHLRRMRHYIEALKELSAAHDAPPALRFDLAECVCDEAHAVEAQLNWPVATVGATPLMVSGRPSLVALIVSNALRNAIEAEKAVKESSTVVATWGETNEGYWVSVIDRGAGLPAEIGKVFEKGTSLKFSHTGMGLAIAARAARSMRGVVTLGPNASNGASLVLRWARDSEKSE